MKILQILFISGLAIHGFSGELALNEKAHIHDGRVIYIDDVEELDSPKVQQEQISPPKKKKSKPTTPASKKPPASAKTEPPRDSTDEESEYPQAMSAEPISSPEQERAMHTSRKVTEPVYAEPECPMHASREAKAARKAPEPDSAEPEMQASREKPSARKAAERVLPVSCTDPKCPCPMHASRKTAERTKPVYAEPEPQIEASMVGEDDYDEQELHASVEEPAYEQPTESLYPAATEENEPPALALREKTATTQPKKVFLGISISYGKPINQENRFKLNSEQAEDLRTRLAHFVGLPITMSRIREIQKAITLFYRKIGIDRVAVKVPAQELNDSILKVRVDESIPPKGTSKSTFPKKNKINGKMANLSF